MTLKTYKCHKTVQAAKIIEMMPYGDYNEQTAIWFKDEDQEKNWSIVVENEYIEKHHPYVGGYYVEYEDSYESFSPADVFEAGYSLKPAASELRHLSGGKHDY
ncbi:MAG: hypothetical protein V3T40_01010 [Nitrososphaerales archaeon]